MSEPIYPQATMDDLRRPSFVSFLNLARWLAAFMVLVSHLRNPLFLGYESVAAADRTLAVKLWFFATGWHAEAVVIFFVLSGYLVGGIAATRSHAGKFSIKHYGVDRITRIYIPFLPALLLTAGLDLAGSSLFASSGFYDHTQAMIREKIATGSFSSLMSSGIFFGNVVLMQGIHLPAFGSNQPLWTISFEFWFYVVFAIALTALYGGSRAVRSIAAVAAIICVLLLGAAFPIYMGLWMLGVGIAFTPAGAIEKPVLSLAAFAGLLVIVRAYPDIAKANSWSIMAKNYVVAIAFAWIVVSLRRVEWRPLTLSAKFNAFMASFSYSLYLIHFPLIMFCLSVLGATGYFPEIATGYRPTDPIGVALYVGLILLIMLLAFLFSLGTERHTGTLRAAIHRAWPSKAVTVDSPAPSP